MRRVVPSMKRLRRPGIQAVSGVSRPPPPGAPTNPAAASGLVSVALTWDASSGATGYNVYRGTTSGGEGGTPIAATHGTSYQDTTTTIGTTYYYKVTASNAAGESARSSEVNASTVAQTSWGLVSIWAEDSLTADLVGTNTLSTTGSPTLVAGKVGSGIQTSNGNYCSRASNSSLQGGNFDYLFWCWVNPNVNSGALFALGKFDGSKSPYILGQFNGKWLCEMSVSGGTFKAINNTSLTTGVETLLVGWVDSVGGNLYLSINGAAPASISLGGGTPDVETAPLGIGYGFGATPEWDGNVNQAGLAKPSSPLGDGSNGTLAKTIYTALWNSGNGIAR